MKMVVREIAKHRGMLVEIIAKANPQWPQSVAARCVLLMEQRAQPLGDGRVRLDFSLTVLDQALADEGLCFECGTRCDNPRRATAAEICAAMATRDHTDTMYEP